MFLGGEILAFQLARLGELTDELGQRAFQSKMDCIFWESSKVNEQYGAE